MPCAPAGLTAPASKRLSCQIRRVKNSSGSSLSAAASASVRQISSTEGLRPRGAGPAVTVSLLAAGGSARVGVWCARAAASTTQAAVSIAGFIATQYQTGAAMIRDTRSVERRFTLELRRAVLLAMAVPLLVTAQATIERLVDGRRIGQRDDAAPVGPAQRAEGQRPVLRPGEADHLAAVPDPVRIGVDVADPDVAQSGRGRRVGRAGAGAQQKE